MTLEYAKNHLHNRQTDRWTDRQMQSDRLLLIRAGLKTNTHNTIHVHTHSKYYDPTQTNMYVHLLYAEVSIRMSFLGIYKDNCEF